MSAERYSAKSIRVLEFPEAIRRRPGMYVGSTEHEGAFRCLREVIDNAIDEYLDGHGNRIRITVDTSTWTFYVADMGRGIPVDIHQATGLPAATTVFTRIHAGAKFDADSYKTSSGMNGVGASATNALSEYFAFWTFRSNKWHHQSFSQGFATSDLKKSSPDKAVSLGCGTVVAFRLDTTLFSDYHPNLDRLQIEARDLSYLNPGLTLEVVIDGAKSEYLSTRGMLDFVSTPDEDPDSLGKSFFFEASTEDTRAATNAAYSKCQVSVSAALCWYDNDAIDIRSYCNSSYTKEAGFHVSALKTALAAAVNGETTDIDARFLIFGLRAAIQIKMQDPVYEGQTKNKLTSPEIVKPVRDLLEPALVEFFTRNKQLLKAIVDRAQKFQSNFTRLTEDNKAVKSMKIVARDARVDLPIKLKQAKPWVHPEDRELIIVEGDSAGTTAKPASFDWQEILPIRGKILNTGRVSLAKVLKSPSVMDIITTIGTPVGSRCDPSKGRVGKIAMLTDADDDGYHIASLLSALFVIYFRPWVEQGRVYFINAPLYLGSYKDQKFFGDTPDEVYSQFKSVSKNNVLLTRAKGWGELRPDQLRLIAMDPSKRRLVRLTIEDDDDMEINHMMGSEVQYRRDLLGIDAGDTEDEGDAT